jgi:3-methyladenine DNA glycosylase AlkD
MKPDGWRYKTVENLDELMAAMDRGYKMYYVGVRISKRLINDTSLKDLKKKIEKKEFSYRLTHGY